MPGRTRHHAGASREIYLHGFRRPIMAVVRALLDRMLARLRL
jgi:hypothetical protein